MFLTIILIIVAAIIITLVDSWWSIVAIERATTEMLGRVKEVNNVWVILGQLLIPITGMEIFQEHKGAGCLSNGFLGGRK